jgi:hypothetical protein
MGLVAAVWVVRFVVRFVGMGFFSLASVMASYLTSNSHLPRLARFGELPIRRARLQRLYCGPAPQYVYKSTGGACTEASDGRGKTVTKPLQLKRLELPLSEKQIPQVVENLESGGKTREALETA